MRFHPSRRWRSRAGSATAVRHRCASRKAYRKKNSCEAIERDPAGYLGSGSEPYSGLDQRASGAVGDLLP
jgi:hypothetical protein